MHVLMLFLDGVGLGARDPGRNPLFRARLPALRWILGGELPSYRNRSIRGAYGGTIPLDANLGVPGLPQSGTGQTALFTGENGARIAGKHFGPYPYSTLRPIIREKNLFRLLRDAGRDPCFANAFPQRFFDYITHRRTRISVTTMSCLFSGIQIRRHQELLRGLGVSADVTGEGWRSLGYPDIPVVTPGEAGLRLAALTEQHEFVLFEYWRTDHAGHAQSMSEAVEVLERLDGVLEGLLPALQRGVFRLVITSDHGNLEDLSVKTHTRNPVPLILAGPGFDHSLAEVTKSSHGKPDLRVVTPMVLRTVLP